MKITSNDSCKSTRSLLRESIMTTVSHCIVLLRLRVSHNENTHCAKLTSAISRRRSFRVIRTQLIKQFADRSREEGKRTQCVRGRGVSLRARNNYTDIPRAMRQDGKHRSFRARV